AVGDFHRVEGRVGRAENRSSPGPMSVGGLAGDPAEHDEDPRLSGRNRGRGRAASPGASAAAEGRQRSGAEGEGGGGSGRGAGGGPVVTWADVRRWSRGGPGGTRRGPAVIGP